MIDPGLVSHMYKNASLLLPAPTRGVATTESRVKLRPRANIA